MHWDTNKSHFLCWLGFFCFFFWISSAKKRCSSWPTTSWKHVLRQLHSIWWEKEGPGCSLSPNNTQMGLFVLRTPRVSQLSSSELPGPRGTREVPGSQSCAPRFQTARDVVTHLSPCKHDGENGYRPWVLLRIKPQLRLGLSMAVALMGTTNNYYLIVACCWLWKLSSER